MRFILHLMTRASLYASSNRNILFHRHVLILTVTLLDVFSTIGSITVLNLQFLPAKLANFSIRTKKSADYLVQASLAIFCNAAVGWG